ncbi:MAG: hypothetical protein ABH879_03135 [archaeon]
MADLQELRERIGNIDGQILELLRQRAGHEEAITDRADMLLGEPERASQLTAYAEKSGLDFAIVFDVFDRLDLYSSPQEAAKPLQDVSADDLRLLCLLAYRFAATDEIGATGQVTLDMAKANEGKVMASLNGQEIAGPDTVEGFYLPLFRHALNRWDQGSVSHTFGAMLEVMADAAGRAGLALSFVEDGVLRSPGEISAYFAGDERANRVYTVVAGGTDKGQLQYTRTADGRYETLMYDGRSFTGRPVRFGACVHSEGGVVDGISPVTHQPKAFYELQMFDMVAFPHPDTVHEPKSYSSLGGMFSYTTKRIRGMCR